MSEAPKTPQAPKNDHEVDDEADHKHDHKVDLKIDHWAQLKKRVPFYVLVLGMALLVIHYYQRQPSEVDVTYRLGPAREGLERLRARYFKASELVHHVTFKLDGDDRPLAHTLRLPDGDYDVRVELFYRERVPPAIRSISRPSGPRSVRIRRPLLVRGSGGVRIFIAEDD